ncbi:MAG: hypothetical protein IKE52_06335 [Mogibacterium sp.]|nr:hypothetical protein [Mogibacterium sp.]
MTKKRSSALKNIIIIFFMTLITAGSFGAYLTLTIDEPNIVIGYAAGISKDVPIYALKDDGKLEQVGSIVRGSKIKRYDDAEKIENAAYFKLRDGASLVAEGKNEEDNADLKNKNNYKYYIAEENTAFYRTDVVKEKEVYVRTPATIYKDEKNPFIASFAPKGSCLKVVGYDRLLDDGSVYKYKVEYADEKEETVASADTNANTSSTSAQGFVYSKYMALSQDEANAVYNGNGVYDEVKDDNYGIELYGGKAANLDYYPTQRPSFAGNEFCEDARAMYINGYAAVNPGKYIKLIEQTDCNAVVIDIKDGYLAYESEVAEEVSPRSYKSAYSSVAEYKKGIDAYRQTGAYLIGRIVVFNDALYAKDHPEDCIKYGRDSSWPSTFSRNVWEYNIRLAVEAAREFGFNEIQFDYVRFPENSFEVSKSGKADFRNIYNEEKGQAVQNFCIYAADMLHEEGIYMSVDVFGESAYGYMTAYGQYWTGISNVADAISAMPYTDHMGANGAWNNPYNTMLSWAKRAKKQQDKTETPAAARTWITGYNTPHWNPTVDYDAKKLKAQVRALNKAGLSGGFIPWNAASDLAKYRQYKDVWNLK